MKEHRLYTNRDADAPESIKDRNGDVVLDLCRDCGAGEGQLAENCTGSKFAVEEQGEKG